MANSYIVYSDVPGQWLLFGPRNKFDTSARTTVITVITKQQKPKYTKATFCPFLKTMNVGIAEISYLPAMSYNVVTSCQNKKLHG